MHIYITANSPGELAGWVAPVVEKLRAEGPPLSITIVITPCQYASGTERAFAESLPGVDAVISAGRLLKELYLGKNRRRRGADEARVLYLGGDALYAVLIAGRLKAPLFGYTNKPRRKKHFHTFLVPDTRARDRFLHGGVAPGKIEIVGHLGLDSLRIGRTREEIFEGLTGSPEERDVVSFLPGSRPLYVEFMVPFFLKVAEGLQNRIPGLNMCFAFSPFTARRGVPTVGAGGGGVREANGVAALATASGYPVFPVWENPHEVMSVSRLIITIPGTNTLQAAALGVPMVTVLPTHRVEQIPMDGLAGLLLPKMFPFGRIRRAILERLARRTRFFAFPNILANAPIVPELIGRIEPEGVAAEAAGLLDDPERCRKMSEALKALTRERGAAGRVAAALLRPRA